MKTVYIFQIDQQITELWHFEILQRVCVAQVFLLILHENLKFKKLYIKLEWKASIWYHEMKTVYIFKIDQQITNTNSLFATVVPIGNIKDEPVENVRCPSSMIKKGSASHRFSYSFYMKT